MSIIGPTQCKKAVSSFVAAYELIKEADIKHYYYLGKYMYTTSLSNNTEVSAEIPTSCGD